MTLTPPLRILHVFRAPLGGLFRHVLDLAGAQLARGHAVGLFCDAAIGNADAEAALAALAPRLPLGLHRRPIARDPGLGDIAGIRALARVRRETHADVLHAHGAKGGAYARLLPLPRGARVARVYTPHGGSFHYRPGTAKHRLYMAAETFMTRRTELFLFESAYVARRFETEIGGAEDRIRIVHNGLAEAEFAPVAPSGAAWDVLYVGELRALKGIDTLIDALALVRARSDRRLRLLAVGSGPDRDTLVARAAAAGLADDVAFEGPRPIREALGRARLMVVPSRAESLPYVVLEAAAARQPLVATNVGGIPEIFGPYAGELIAPDDPAALAARIVARLDEPESARAASAQALAEHVRARFSLDAMVDGVLAGYASALAARARAAGPLVAAASS